MSEMIVSLIVAVANNRAIGKDNDLIWHLPKDMAFFKNTTKGHYVLMGRKNYDSIPEKYRPLPARPNVIITRNPSLETPGAEVAHSVEEAIELARNAGETEAFVIGGGAIYAYALENDLIDKMYITWIDKAYDGDTFFPEVDLTPWKAVSEERFDADEKHESGFTIIEYVRASNKLS